MIPAFRPVSLSTLAAPILLALPLVASERAPVAPEAVPPPAPAAPAGGLRLCGPTFDRVAYDEPGDGALWARGADYKVRFGADGTTYWPRVGQRASVNLALSPEAVTSGGTPLAFDRAAIVGRAGDRVELDRGSFVEAYELESGSIEQLFVFPSLPSRGELVLRMPGSDDLAGANATDALEFRGDEGRVRYGHAIAIDADGRRVAAPTSIENGDIVIRVGAEFLATAAFPLTIDPTVTNTWLDTTGTDTREPDIAWDPFHGVWLAVYEVTFSATDTDIFAEALGSNNATLATAWVDFTGVSWKRPRVANNGAAHKFLVVAERVSTTPTGVVGRSVQPNGTILTLGSQFDIGGSADGNLSAPVVGGDPYPGGLSYFCVAFQNTIDAQQGRIGYRLVNQADLLVGTSTTWIPSVFNAPDSQPAISKSNDATRWFLVWRRDDSIFRGDIYGAHILWAGDLLEGPFGITATGLANDQQPSVATQQRGTYRTIVALQRNSLASTNYSVVVVPLDGTVAGAQVDISVLENSGQTGVAQIEPSIDGDGRHFLLAYSEFDPNFLNYDVFASDLYLSGSTIGLSQAHVNVFHLGLSQRNARVSAAHNALGDTTRYALTYNVRQNDVDFDLLVSTFDVLRGGATSTFCFGDGSQVACPCGNQGSAQRGCGNSVFPGGGRLTVTGTASTLADTVQLHASDLPNSTCLFFQGTASSAPAAFGDGLRCVTGTVVRLMTRSVSANTALFPTGIDLPLAQTGLVPIDGGTRTYQVWYRNSAAFCTAATFNLTNGVRVEWSR